jgi:hypothetical protein
MGYKKFIIIIIIIIIIINLFTANGFVSGGSGTTMRQKTQSDSHRTK